MRRSAMAPWAGVLALALTAGPAAAAPGDPAQQITNSTGAAQAGPVQADAPVRVLSDGDNAATQPAQPGDQATGDSNASAQVGTAQVDAPVRVASDGDNAGSEQPAVTVDQGADNSDGAAQVADARVNAPVRVASEQGSGA